MSASANAQLLAASDAAPDQARLIEHYMRFVLRDEGGPTRERLHQGLAELALKTGNPQHAMTALDVQARIIRSTGLPNYPLPLVTKALAQLAARHDVHPLPKPAGSKQLYRLSVSRFTAVDQALSQTDKQDQDFRESVVKRLEAEHGRLNREDRETVGTAFIDFVGRMLGALGERCAHRLIEERSGQQLSYPSIQDDLAAAVRGLPAQLQGDARHAFEEALRHPSDEEANYLYSAGQVFYISELLNVDPALQYLQRRRFEKTTLFLDTNILLALIHPKDESHHAVSQMASLCKAAGFKLVYAPKTAEEFDGLITAAEKEFRNTPPFNTETAASFALAVSNPILRGWLESFSEHKASWSQYRAKIGAWRSKLEQMDVNTYSLPDVARGKQFQALADSLSSERRSRRGEAREPKRPRAVEHDAELVTGIETLVAADSGQPDPFGPRFWLITHDKHLVDCARASREASSPCMAMLADEWVQYISPFLSPNTSNLDPAAAFAGLLSSRFMPSLGRRMSLNELRVFAEPEVAALTSGLSPEDACRAISDAHLEAVTRGGSAKQTDERAVRRLADIAKKKRGQMHQRGELISADRLEALRKERDKEAVKFSEMSLEQTEQLADLEKRLEAAEADRRTSLSHWIRLSRSFFTRKLSQGRAWLKNHRLRAMLAAIVFLVVAVILILGIGDVVTKSISIGILILTIFTMDFDQVRRNFARLFGS